MEGISANLLEQLNFRWNVIRIQSFLNADLFCKMLLLHVLTVFASLVWLHAWPKPLKAAVPVLLCTIPVLLCTTKCYSSTTVYYKVLLQHYSVRCYSSTIQRTTEYYSSTTLFYRVLLQYYSVLQNATPKVADFVFVCVAYHAPRWSCHSYGTCGAGISGLR